MWIEDELTNLTSDLIGWRCSDSCATKVGAAGNLETGRLRQSQSGPSQEQLPEIWSKGPRRAIDHYAAQPALSSGIYPFRARTTRRLGSAISSLLPGTLRVVN